MHRPILADSQELLARPIPGGWMWRTIEVADHAWELLLPADQNAFLQQTANDDEWPDPYWTQIWPAARSMAALVLARNWPAETRLLELGCGSGLVGLAALARGCHVTFSDYVPLAVELACANARHNGFAQVQGKVLDWRSPGTEPRYSTIIAADVIYDSELHQPLLNTLKARLHTGGFVWLAEPGRMETANAFLQLAAEAGWLAKFVDEQGSPCESLQPGQFRRVKLTRNAD
ncbi:ribosomal protein L11 methyltransferase [Anatilimnocola aggregata]|uniref:Ribosomal protein L11 methyltransferase n=1 Tax=Anatilimnocola aggregata TaxID=2528021 RepID=A0A517YA62_9BACT|nr:methyltransferase domain-containing protein [Anatilimnocola aggregata]QDU27119.1 ribosomal protein L11 methyltransferase [Anatilimnocola aggregata]